MQRLGLAILVVALAFGVRLVYASVTITQSAGQGFSTILIGGITGPCGYLSGGSNTGGVYGHDISGTSCPTNSDDKSSVNYLTATCTEDDGGAHNYTITAKTTMNKINYADGSAHATSCPATGPPFNYTGSSVIELSNAAAGTTGSPHATHTDAATLGGTSYGPLGPFSHTAAIPWDVDPQDPTTATKVVSAKVSVAFGGTAADCVCTNDKHDADCQLTVTVS